MNIATNYQFEILFVYHYHHLFVVVVVVGQNDDDDDDDNDQNGTIWITKKNDLKFYNSIIQILFFFCSFRFIRALFDHIIIIIIII